MKAHAAGRRAAALVVMLVLLAVIMMLGAGWMQRIAGQRQQLRQQQFQVQAARLAESGIGRAWAHLAVDADYAGETWQITADEWEANRTATVRIVVDAPALDAPANDAESLSITSLATYPAGHSHAVRERRTATFFLNSEGK